MSSSVGDKRKEDGKEESNAWMHFMVIKQFYAITASPPSSLSFSLSREGRTESKTRIPSKRYFLFLEIPLLSSFSSIFDLSFRTIFLGNSPLSFIRRDVQGAPKERKKSTITLSPTSVSPKSEIHAGWSRSTPSSLHLLRS